MALWGLRVPRPLKKMGMGAGNPGPTCCVEICGGGFKFDTCVGADNDDADGRCLESWITVSQPRTRAEVHEPF